MGCEGRAPGAENLDVAGILTNTERQARYRQKIRTGKTKRLQVVLPLQVGMKVDYLCDSLHCNKTESIGRLIMEEWERQGRPVSSKLSPADGEANGGNRPTAVTRLGMPD